MNGGQVANSVSDSSIFRLTQQSLYRLKVANVRDELLLKLKKLESRTFQTQDVFFKTAEDLIGKVEIARLKPLIVNLNRTPRDPLEFELVQIWQTLLGVSSIRLNDSLSELGVTIPLMKQLFVHVEEVFHTKLSPAAVSQEVTVEKMASILRQQGCSAISPSLVALQTQGSKPSMFFVPPSATSVIQYADAAKYLGSKRSFYGLQPRGLDGKMPPHTSIQSMATHYLKEVRSLQPEGPYLLGGMCVGGIVAFEMAQQIQAQGQKVALLVLIEPNLPTSVNSAYKPLSHHLKLFGLSFKVFLRQIAYFFGGRVYHQHIRDAHDKARITYITQAYKGRFTYFASGECTALQQQGKAKWSNIWFDLATEGVDMHVIPCAHDDLTLEPAVFTLIAKLKACLDSV